MDNSRFIVKFLEVGDKDKWTIHLLQNRTNLFVDNITVNLLNSSAAMVTKLVFTGMCVGGAAWRSF